MAETHPAYSLELQRQMLEFQGAVLRLVVREVQAQPTHRLRHVFLARVGDQPIRQASNAAKS